MNKSLRRPKILQRGGDDRPQPDTYPLSVGVTGEELSDLSMQLLLRDGVLVDGSQMVQLQLNDSMLLE
ncbi:hypothetical protein O3G_MSEX011206 [Manduca sexta]|uniref:Uncharacterized protein n=1 Tax=Manduca sexta TaxID=7130 RepID=A0A922CUT9_MANSE|nr:hypothetical protein O3G_MSEX011206 [Manduca sexta]KAG6459110.1 hypothetical protein O3G_MSEX011206 [Manduca sexta]